MFIVNHAAAGAITGAITGNPLLGFVIGFLSHFPLDMFPHGDRGLARDTKTTRNFQRFFVVLFFDVLATFVLLMVAFSFNLFNHPWVAFWGAVGGILPDFIVGIYEYFVTIRQKECRSLAWFFLIHELNHFHIITSYDLSFGYGTIYQLAALALFIKLW